MKQLWHLIKHDFVLLKRNNIITVSLLVTLLYIAVFKGLSSFGDMEKLLVLVIFNDPALLGFLFIGVIVLFEKNEYTLQALSTTPIKVKNYILSKTISLTFVALLCCYAMAFATKGFDFNILQYSLATVITSTIFSFIGFIVVANQQNFNSYMIRAIGVIILLSLPFVAYFDLISKWWFFIFPTQAALDLYSLSFSKEFDIVTAIYAYGASILWIFISYKYAIKAISNILKR